MSVAYKVIKKDKEMNKNKELIINLDGYKINTSKSYLCLIDDGGVIYGSGIYKVLKRVILNNLNLIHYSVIDKKRMELDFKFSI